MSQAAVIVASIGFQLWCIAQVVRTTYPLFKQLGLIPRIRKVRVQ
jgi:hypothetical protein